MRNDKLVVGGILYAKKPLIYHPKHYTIQYSKIQYNTPKYYTILYYDY